MDFQDQEIKPDTIKPCTECRVKKVKCLGTLPICSRCKKFGLQCDLEKYVFYNYSTVQMLMHKIEGLEQSLRLDSISSNGKSTTGVNSLSLSTDTRMETNGDHQVPIRDSISSNVNSQDSPNSVHHHNGINESDNNVDENTSPDEIDQSTLLAGNSNVISLDELSNEVGSLTSANDDKTQGKYIGAATGSNFAKAFLKRMHLQKLDDFNHLSASDFSGFDSNSALYSTSCAPLPPYSVTKAAINIYIEDIHPFYPIIIVKDFFDTVELMYTSPSSLTYYDKFMIFVIIAIGLERGEKHTELLNYYNQFKPVEFFNTSQKYLDQLISSRSVQVLQMLLLNMIWLNNTNVFKDDYGDMWYLGRYLMSLAMELNLHLTLYNDNLSEKNTELRSRLFWVTYLLERKNAVKFGRGLSIKRQEIETNFPVVTKDDYLNITKLKDNYGKVFFTPSLLAIELYEIYGLLLETIYISRTKGIKPLIDDEDLLNYKSEISNQIFDMIEKINEKIDKNLQYHHVLKIKALIINVMLNRPSPSFPSPDNECLISCKESCLDAIKSFQFLTNSKSLWKTDPSCLHDLVNIGLTMIFCCWKTESDSEVLKTFSTTTIEVMNDMIKYYPSFIKFKNLYIIVSTIIIQNLDKAFEKTRSDTSEYGFQDIPSPLQHLKQNMMFGPPPTNMNMPIAMGGGMPIPMQMQMPMPMQMAMGMNRNMTSQNNYPQQQPLSNMPPPNTVPHETSENPRYYTENKGANADNSINSNGINYNIRQKNSHLRSSSIYDAQSPMGTPVHLTSKQPVTHRPLKRQLLHKSGDYPPTTQKSPSVPYTSSNGTNQLAGNELPINNQNEQYTTQQQPMRGPSQNQQQQQQQQSLRNPVLQQQYQFPQQQMQLQQQQQQAMMGLAPGNGNGSNMAGVVSGMPANGVNPQGYVDPMTQELFQDVFKNYYQGNDNIREDLDQLFEFQRFNWA